MPERATVAESDAVVRVCARAESHEGAVILDLRNTTFLGPLAVALLASCVALRARDGRQTSFEFPRQADPARFFSEVGLSSFAAGDSTGAGTLEVRQMATLDASYTRAVTEMLVRGVPGIDEANSYPIELCLNELLQNVFEWAESAVGCFVLARWYHKSRSVRVAVVDRGIGIPGALRRGPVKRLHSASDAELILEAVTTPRLTSRSNQVGGLGLKNVSETVLQRRGRLTVLSLSAKLSWSDENLERADVPRFGGTAIELEFRPDAPVERPYDYVPVF